MTNSKIDPSAAFTDSISLFTQSATQAFSDLLAQTRTDVARAEADARHARNERDKALKSLQESQKEARQCKGQVLEYKTALKEAELTIRHHLENIALLQRETSQWKGQAKNWQEHFLRVEQERCSLTSRMDELVTERLIPTYQPNASSGAFDGTLSPESPTLSRSTKSSKYKDNLPRHSELPPYSVAAQTPQTTKRSPIPPGSTSRGHHKASAAAPSHHKQVTPPETPADQQPRQILIRKVHAVVEIKQEEESDEDLSEQPPKSPEEAEAAPIPRRSRRSRQIINDDDDYESNELSPEVGWNGIEEAEDDELMIGAGDDLNFMAPDAQASSSRRQARTTKTVPSKKRKLNAADSSKPKARRKT